MAIPEGLGNMLGSAGAEKAGEYVPYVGTAYKIYKGYGAYKAGGIKGLAKSFMPFGGGLFGGGGSRTNAMARQYMALVNQFDTKFLKPTLSSLTDVKRNINPSMRIGSESFRSVLRQFEGAGASLRDMVGRSDFGSISGRITKLSDLAKRVQRALGGRGAGPDQPIQSIAGTQNIPVPSGELERSVLNLPGAYHGGVFSPIESEGHRFPVTTTQTPGGRRNRKSSLMKTPGILT